MSFPLKDEEIQELERQLNRAYEPIKPRQEFVDRLRQRILDPAPKVFKARSCLIDLRYIVIIMGAITLPILMGIIVWKIFIAKNPND